jgi:hypothetical protein
MQGPTDEASVPMNYVIDKRMLGVKQRRKIGTRTMPVPAEALPVAKRPRLQASTLFPTAADGVAASDPPDDTPTALVTPAASLPNATASRAPCRTWKRNGEEDAKLIEAVKKHGEDWSLVAAMVPGRTNVQCRMRWVVVDKPFELKYGVVIDWSTLLTLPLGKAQVNGHQKKTQS